MFMVIVSTLGGILKAVMVVLVIAACIKYLRQNERKRGSHRFHGAGAKHRSLLWGQTTAADGRVP